MKRKWSVSILIVAALALLLAAADPAPAMQCAMCKQAVAASSNAAEAARGLNLAILVLLIPPVAIFAGVFGAFYKLRDVQGQRQYRDRNE